MNLWPLERHRAVLWMFAKYVTYTTDTHRAQNPATVDGFIEEMEVEAVPGPKAK